MTYLEILRCKTHGQWAISVGDSNGGTRITAIKCCGRWDTVKQFPMSADRLREAVIVFENAIEPGIGA